MRLYLHSLTFDRERLTAKAMLHGAPTLEAKGVKYLTTPYGFHQDECGEWWYVNGADLRIPPLWNDGPNGLAASRGPRIDRWTPEGNPA